MEGEFLNWHLSLMIEWKHKEMIAGVDDGQ
jgi:hypothetical protein